MFLRPIHRLILALLFAAAALPGLAQDAPAAIQTGPRLFVGAGASAYHDDYSGQPTSNVSGKGHMEGGTVWLDFYPDRGPAILHGLALEIEGRDISIGPGPTQPNNLREDTGGGGVIYSWRHFPKIVPYGKFMWEHASIDFHSAVLHYNHDTRSLHEGGGGADFYLSHNVWLRAGFEEQVWQRLFETHANPTTTGIGMKPRGVTIGVSYSFIHHRHLHTSPN